MQLTANTEVLKEPRGFIKFIEIFLAICAFATAVGPHIATTFKCCGNPHQMVEISMHYPYGEGETNVTNDACQCGGASTVTTSTEPSSVTSDSVVSSSVTPASTTAFAAMTTAIPPTEFDLPDECQSSSEFYVFIGVTAFLFSLAAIVFYVFAHEQYAGLSIIPKADFVVTIFFTLFWLFSSAAFAAAVSKIKNVADPNWLSNQDNTYFRQCFAESVCMSDEGANYATLNVSIIFGFLNMIVWGGNNWFLYKETNWFGTDSSTSLPPQSMPTSTSEVQPTV